MSDEVSPDFSNLIRSAGRFTVEQIEALRKSLPISGNVASPMRLYTRDRLNIEILESLLRLDSSIRRLDQSSTELVTTTNRVPRRTLYLTWVGVVLGIVGLVLAAVQAFHLYPKEHVTTAMPLIQRSCSFDSVRQCTSFLTEYFSRSKIEIEAAVVQLDGSRVRKPRTVPHYLFRGEAAKYPNTVSAFH